jgi:threonine/homoserine/homoserine lactone efflux protein
MRPLPIAVHVATSVLLVNMLVALLDGPGWLVALLFLAGPALVLWMVWQVLRDKSMPMAELEAQEEWGYQDRRDLRPVEGGTLPEQRASGS